jgi:hypothetical protein
MTPLPTTYRKNGYDYELIERKGDTAIFSQKDGGKIIAFEVFEVIKQKEWSAFGKTYPPKETIPPTESWGTNAFTVHSIGLARYKAEEIQRRVDGREEKRLVIEMVAE